MGGTIETVRGDPGRVPGLTRFTVIAVLVGLATIAVLRGLEQQEQGDFHVFWAAGGRYFNGEPLYVTAPGERAFQYPPFAAMGFQLLWLLPFRSAAVLFSLVNVGLAVVAFRLTAAILSVSYPERRPGPWPMAGAALLSGQYVLNNLNLGQSNAVVLGLVLGGIYLSMTRREASGGACLVVATAFKIMPVVFVAWLLIRRTRRAIVGIVSAVILLFGLHLAGRGWTRGIGDLRDYQQVFLGDFETGRVITDYTNQNLASLIYRMTQPSRSAEGLDYRILPTSPATARWGYALGAFGIGTIFLLFLLCRRIQDAPFSPFEVSAGFLTWHLLSGITWKAHLVSFIFVFATVLSVPLLSLGRWERRIVQMSIAMICVIGLNGRDLVGRTAHYYFGGFSLITWTMLLLFGLSLHLSRDARHPPMTN
jgi:hypothetical protein